MRFFSVLSLCFILFCSVLSPAWASEDADEQPVQLLDPASDAGSLAVFFSDQLSTVQAGNTELMYAPYIGSGWITGTAPSLGEVFVYVPISSRGAWGTTSDGYLCNVGGSSISGVLFTSSGTQYTFSAPSFSLPRYRLSNSSGSYNYSDLQLTVSGSNLQIATEFEPAVPVSDAVPFVVVGLLGVMILCLMRSRH